MFKQIMACLGLAALAMASPASSQQSPQNPTGQPLRIGASASLTGKAFSVQGNYVREGYLLCRKHVNAQGGVLGRPIEFVIYDDESDGKKAALLYEKLITEDKVDVVLGPYGTEITETVADVSEKHHKLMIAPTAATSSIWQKGRRYIIVVLAPVDSAAIGVHNTV
jgi:branched-chain amino acid transport system substrate-binding protein